MKHLLFISILILSIVAPVKVSALTTTDVSGYSYALYTEDMAAMAGRQMIMTLSMKNATYISGFQTDLVLPEGFSVAFIEDEEGEQIPQVELLRTLPTRHSMSVSLQDDGSYRLLSISTDNRNYGGFDGPVANIVINVADYVLDGNYPIMLRNQILAEVKNTDHKVPLTEAVIHVRNPEFTVDTALPDVEITDLSGLDNMLYTTTFKALRGRQATLELKMRNSTEITGFQADILLPSGFTLAKDAQGNALAELGHRTNSSRHALNVAQQADGSYRVIVFSTINNTISGTDGTVASLTFNVSEEMEQGEYKVIIRKQELGKPDNSNIKPEPVNAKLRVEIPGYTYDLMNLKPYMLYTDNVGVHTGERVTIPIGMANLNTICGFQADLILPEGVTVATETDEFGDEMPMITYGTRTTQVKHSINCVRQADGSYRILCASTSNKNLSGHLGTVFYLTLNVPADQKCKMYTIYMINQEFGESNNSQHKNSVPFVSRLFVRNQLPKMSDLTKDGKVDAEDVEAITKMLLHTDTEEYEEEAGDSNKDGHFSIADFIDVIRAANFVK